MDTKPLTLLGIFAHPADMATEVGGTLAVHSSNGDCVYVIILTHGARVHPNIYIEEDRKTDNDKDAQIAEADKDLIKKIKREEMDSAADILGVHRPTCLDYDDGLLTVNNEYIRQVEQILTKIQPDLILTHHPGFHSGIGEDHCLTGQISVAATISAALRLKNIDRTDAHFVKQIYFIARGVSSRSSIEPGGGPINDVYIDITPVIAKKIHAMDQFVSQGYAGDFARKCVAGHNGHWGSLAGVPFAEAFMRKNTETHSQLPIAEIHRQRDERIFHRGYSELTNVWSIPHAPSPTDKYLKPKEV
jgi:LmbE family N-acetylglucosaminyl deacetylase